MSDRKYTAEVNVNGAGFGTFVIDGKDLANSTVGATLTVTPGQGTRVELDLRMHRTEVNGEAVVSVPPCTHEALVHLGWTPPVEPVPVGSAAGADGLRAALDRFAADTAATPEEKA